MIKVLPISAKQAREAYESDDWLSSGEANNVFTVIREQMYSTRIVIIENLSEEGREALIILGYKITKVESTVFVEW